jgi:protein-S-isoprenylcysteine O-methyltransferase Ste14
MNKWPKIARRIRVPVGFAFAALYVVLAHPSGKSILIGIVFIIFGLAIRATASGQLKKNEELASDGPYAYTRNPLYLGSLILALGFAVASLNVWIGVLAVVIFAAIYLPVIKAEETFLAQKFPNFESYAREVPRLFPRLPSRSVKHDFSWKLYRKHREYNSALGSLALITTLIVKMFLHRA